MTQNLKTVTLMSFLLLISTIVQANQSAMTIQAISNSDQGKSQFQQQKEQMPKMLELMKSMEVCLSKASSQADADGCERNFSQLSRELGLDEDEYIDDEEPLVWNKNTKAQVLSELNEGIKRMEEIMPCIQKAQDMKDMMNCNRTM